MSKYYRIILLPLLFLSTWPAAAIFAKPKPQNDAPANFKVVHIIGLEGVKHNTKGQVAVSKDTLEFTTGPTKSDISVASIQDVLTGGDSQRLIGGTLGTLTMFAPYESGRFLSLFRTKIDTLTISYHDSNGALHGAIFTLPEGQAAMLKKQMVAEGAKTSMSVEDETNSQTSNKKAKENK